MKKVLLICTASQSVINFRKNFILELKKNGFEVFVIAFDDSYKPEIEDIGANFYSIQDRNRSINPLGILTLCNRYKKIISDIQPDAVFTFMLKPNVFGIQAARKSGITNIFAMVEGAGDVFIQNTLKWQFIRKGVCLLYKRAFRNAEKVFFLNEDDKNEFVVRKLVKGEKCVVIPGIGVNLSHFSYKTLKNDQTFLMIARMLETKGVLEYCECARIVKRAYPNAVFNYIGAEGSLTVADIQQYIDDGSISYLGTTKDVRPFLEDCTAFVLPSYREGLPMSVMEAEAIGRCIIASDCIGCRDTVINGYNGFLVPLKDSRMLAEKCLYMIEHKDETSRMAENSRRFAEDHFDQMKINQKIMNLTLFEDSSSLSIQSAHLETI